MEGFFVFFHFISVFFMLLEAYGFYLLDFDIFIFYYLKFINCYSMNNILYFNKFSAAKSKNLIFLIFF